MEILTPKAPIASSLSASCTTASSTHPPFLCISATRSSHVPAVRSFFSVDHEIRGMIDRSKDICSFESMDSVRLDVRKGAKTVSREDVSAYFATNQDDRNAFSDNGGEACLISLPSAMS